VVDQRRYLLPINQDHGKLPAAGVAVLVSVSHYSGGSKII